MKQIADIQVGPLQGVGKLATPSDPFGQFNNIISSIIAVMTVIAAIWFVFVFITGAIAWIGSGGDKAALESAKKRMINGLIGIIVVVAALFVIEILGNVIGLTILNPGDLLQQIK